MFKRKERGAGQACRYLNRSRLEPKWLLSLCFAWGLGREQSSGPARARCPIHSSE